ncbi:MAG: hypothetical protein DGJ47_000922 [Rickettsiaceae bacterium]
MKIITKIYLAIYQMVEHDGVEHSGYMSFMMLMSIFPFFIFMLAFTNFFGASELGEMFIEVALQNLPPSSIESIKDQIEGFLSSPPEGLLTLAIFGTLWTASSFVECLRTILNRVYEVRNAPNYILRRLLSMVQFIFISSAISAAMLMLVIVPIIVFKVKILADLIIQYKFLINVTRYGLIFLSLFLTISSLYYIIPNARIRFREVIPGTLLVMFAWSSSGYFLSKYISYYNQFSIIYGSLGSIIITLIFFYIINMIFIIGAEFNYLMSKKSKA